MKRVSIIVIVLLSISVSAFYLMKSTRDCKVDDAFEKAFKKQIQTLENFATIDFGTEKVEDVLYAVAYLQAVTRIESAIYLGDAVLYDKKDFKKDKRAWNLWLKKSSCGMTTAKADSLFKTNPGPLWPIE